MGYISALTFLLLIRDRLNNVHTAGDIWRVKFNYHGRVLELDAATSGHGDFYRARYAREVAPYTLSSCQGLS